MVLAPVYPVVGNRSVFAEVWDYGKTSWGYGIVLYLDCGCGHTNLCMC